MLFAFAFQMQFTDGFAHFEKEKSELGRLVEVIFEACQQIEVNANLQESKLHTECDILKRIIDDRRDAILHKINETKTRRVRQLTQRATKAKQCLDSLSTSIFNANDLNGKSKAQRISDVLENSKTLDSKNFKIENQDALLDFSNEKRILESMDILEAPSAPRICEELCTQSHDKVMIQWRSPDHQQVDMYELQYAVGNNEVGRLEWISPPKSNSWMIVPNIKECIYTLHGLQSGTRYLFAVKAKNKAGCSFSDIVNIKTLGMPFQFDSHSLHKKLRLSNHNYTVYREESGSRAKKESLMGGYSSSNISMYGVTGNVAIDNGRHYWEVVVSQSSHFTIGVCYDTVTRYEWTGNNNKSWVMCRNNQGWSARHNSKDILLFLQTPFPKKIGILLDFDSGYLSFFDGASGRHIHTFRVASFERPVRPCFALGKSSLTLNSGITIPDQLHVFDPNSHQT